MSTAIIGLASSGKTTVFNALTRGRSPKGSYGAAKSMNIGIGVKPDARLEHLNQVIKPRRKVNAEMTFWDIPSDYASGTLFNGETINSLQNARSLLAVVRAFEDPAVPHLDGSIDWARDLEKIAFEILFADIALIDRRIERVAQSMKALKSSERVDADHRIEVLKRIQSDLESGIALRSKQLDAAESRVLSGTFTLSSLPLVIAVNVAENDADLEADALISDFKESFDRSLIGASVDIVPICASLEEELRTMDEQDAYELRNEFGLQLDYSEALMNACLASQSIRTFYTESEREVRAWHYSDGLTAPEVAGLVHSDMERGFIRAEVVAFDDFKECGSMEEAKKRGALRREGRYYLVADGDIVLFLFSV